MKKLRIVYGFSPFEPIVNVRRSYVYLIGVNGEIKEDMRFDGNESDTSWRNDNLTCARYYSDEISKFYGIKPERMENGLVVPRAFNAKFLLPKP